MTRLKKKVDDLLDDTDSFMKSLHSKNPFENGIGSRAPFQYHTLQSWSKSGQNNLSSLKARYLNSGGSGRIIKSSERRGSHGYLKDTFNSKYQRHINEIQKLTNVSRNSKNSIRFLDYFLFFKCTNPWFFTLDSRSCDSRRSRKSKKAFSLKNSRSISPISRSKSRKSGKRYENHHLVTTPNKDTRPPWNFNFSNNKLSRGSSNRSKMGYRATTKGFGNVKRAKSNSNKVERLELEVSHLKNDNLLLHRMVKNLQRELNTVKGQN